MAKREAITFCHKGTYGTVELVNGKPTNVTWKTATAQIESCCPAMRASVDEAILAKTPLPTTISRLSELESQVAGMRENLGNLAAQVDSLFGGGRGK